MKLDEKITLPHSCLAIVGNIVQPVTFNKGKYPEIPFYKVTAKSGKLLGDCLEYDFHDVLDVYVQFSDGGDTLSIVHVLDEPDESLVFPPTSELEVKMWPHIQDFMRLVRSGQMYAEDLQYAMKIFTTPAFHYAALKKNNGDYDAAFNEIEEKVFCLSEYLNGER